eukprot:scaffold3446_cov393-Prasinococcus_capsulatus_cf.AAC.6
MLHSGDGPRAEQAALSPGSRREPLGVYEAVEIGTDFEAFVGCSTGSTGMCGLAAAPWRRAYSHYLTVLMAV